MKNRIWEWTKWEGYALYEKYARRDRNRNLNLHGERESSTTNYFQTNVAGKRKFKFSILFSQQGWNEAHRTTRRETRRGLTRVNQVPRFFFQKIDFSIDPVDRTNDSFVSKHIGRYRNASHGERDENAFRIQRGKFSRDFTYHLPHSIVPLRFRGWHFQRRKKISMINPLCPTSFHRG